MLRAMRISDEDESISLYQNHDLGVQWLPTGYGLQESRETPSQESGDTSSASLASYRQLWSMRKPPHGVLGRGEDALEWERGLQFASQRRPASPTRLAEQV